MALAALLPALLHGRALGSYDLLAGRGLTFRPGVVPHNRQAIDLATQMTPWAKLAWTQVHSGHLPLWNPYSALGMPLAFNWISSAFSVPALVGYLAPLSLAFTVQVVVTLVIAGTGMYVLGRTLGLGAFASTMAATVFELSGPMMGWLGWPHVSVMSWAGWLFAAALWVIRGRRRAVCVALFALFLACSVYGGMPEVEVLLVGNLALFCLAFLALRARRDPTSSVVRPVVDLCLAGAAGAALAAPLLLPALKLTAHSVRRNTHVVVTPIPLHDLLGFVVQGFDGLPVAGSAWFDTHHTLYPYAADFIGAIGAALALLAIMARWRQASTLTFVVLLPVDACLVFVPQVIHLLAHAPSIGGVTWVFALEPLCFALAALTGIGTETVLELHREPRIRRLMLGIVVGLSIALLAVWCFGRGHLPPTESAIRARSFLLPAVEALGGVVVVAGSMILARRSTGRRHAFWNEQRVRYLGRGILALLVLGETGVLLAAGAPLLPSSSAIFPTTPAVLKLQHTVGSSLVGCDVETCWGGNGIVPNANAAYAIHEFAIYDGTIPLAYFTAWRNSTLSSAYVNPLLAIFSPLVTTTTSAQLFGIQYVLVPLGRPGPRGSVFDTRIGAEDLYRIPDSGSATVVPLARGGRFPGDFAPGAPVALKPGGGARWTVQTSGRLPKVLRLRLTDVPGWHASIDGRPLPLRPFATVMLQARVPPGRHRIEVWYWPTTFTAGLLIAGAALVALVLAVLWERRRACAPSLRP